MGTISERLGYFLDSETFYCGSFKFSFGYDNSSGTYKVVAFRILDQYHSPSWRNEVKVFNLRDNCWSCFELRFAGLEHYHVVHLIGTINWLALSNIIRPEYDWTHINAENFVILSLSLSTERYTQLLLPNGFNEDLHVCPTLQVLRNCLCFSHDFRGTEFVIWQMREFGIRESWIQLIKVSYETFQIKNLPMNDHMYGIHLVPLYENSGMLIFAKREE